MKRTESLFTALSLVIITVVAVSCARPAVKNMIPPLYSLDLISTDKTVKVADVKGGRKPQFGGMETIDNETFKEALINTLEQARLFKEITTDKKADYELYVEIITQNMKTRASLAYTVLLYINYTLVKTDSNEEIWQRKIKSRYEATVEEAFSGATRMVRALEGSVKDNLSQLLQRLSKLPHLSDKK